MTALTVAEIDLEALRHNVRQLRRLIGPRCAILGVVKADAYGHGAVPISRALLDEGAGMLGVARLEEGIHLREAGIAAPILLMGGVMPDEAETTIRHGLRPVVFDLVAVDALDRAARRLDTRVRVHVKLDTGMGRLGFEPERIRDVLEALAWRQGVVLEGVMTHFAAAEADRAFTDEQLRRFEAALETCARGGVVVPLRHAANSGGILATARTHFDMVRPGLMLYGYVPVVRVPADVDLHPVLKWTTRIVQVRTCDVDTTISYGRTFTTTRKSCIAVLPVGYADGLSRALSNLGRVLIRGRSAPIVGRICMDMTMVDVTDHDRVSVGDEVVLIGAAAGASITAQEHADLARTIPYEILCRIGQRVPRVHLDAAAPAEREEHAQECVHPSLASELSEKKESSNKENCQPLAKVER